MKGLRVKRKIWCHKFVNLAVLLKGGVEDAELFGRNSKHRKRTAGKKTKYFSDKTVSVDVVVLFYVHGKQLRSCRDDQLT